jgi:hypothetical protein
MRTSAFKEYYSISYIIATMKLLSLEKRNGLDIYTGYDIYIYVSSMITKLLTEEWSPCGYELCLSIQG